MPRFLRSLFGQVVDGEVTAAVDQGAAGQPSAPAIPHTH